MKSTKKHYIAICLVITISIGLVGILAWASSNPYADEGSFNRVFSEQRIQLTNVIDKPKFVIDIFEGNRDSVYFQTTSADSIVIADLLLKSLRVKGLGIETNSKINSAFYPFIDSSEYGVLAGRMPGIITIGKQGNQQVDSFPGVIFTRAAKIGKDSYVFRIFDRKEKTVNQVFMKGNIKSRELVKEKNISEKNNDAGISTDGRILFDKSTNKIVYAAYARNSFLCLDTNLNLYSTIKAVSAPAALYEMKAGDISDKNESVHTYTNVSPRVPVHPYACVFNGKIYSMSGIKAVNESSESFREGVTIDQYDILTGKYLGSFKIPSIKGEKPKKFRITTGALIVVYQNYIASYLFNQA